MFAVAAALVGPAILERMDDARVTAAHKDMNRLANALERYRYDNHIYPTTEQGLEALIRPPEGPPVPGNWNPDGYLKRGRLPLDPWGNPYQYESELGIVSFSLYSLGADGEPGGEGIDAEIHYKAE